MDKKIEVRIEGRAPEVEIAASRVPVPAVLGRLIWRIEATVEAESEEDAKLALRQWLGTN